MRLNAVAIDIFHKTLHGLVRLANEVFERKLSFTGRAAHGDLMAGSRYVQFFAANRALKRGFGITRGKIAH